MEFIELRSHPWFVASQFHPEFTSTPRDGHPLFAGFVRAAREYRRRACSPAARTRMKLVSFEVGPDRPFFLIAGPCVIESEALVVEVAGRLRDMTATLGIPFIFKASFDKANRSSRSSFRGPGIEAGLKALALVRKQIGRTRAHRRARGYAARRSGRGGRCAADAGVSLPPDEFHHRRSSRRGSP